MKCPTCGQICRTDREFCALCGTPLKRKKRNGGLIALLVIVLLLALVCAAPFIYNATVHFAYDDYEKLADGAGELFDLSTASNYGSVGGEYYSWQASHDGPELVIHDLSGLSISAKNSAMMIMTVYLSVPPFFQRRSSKPSKG